MPVIGFNVPGRLPQRLPAPCSFGASRGCRTDLVSLWCFRFSCSPGLGGLFLSLDVQLKSTHEQTSKSHRLSESPPVASLDPLTHNLTSHQSSTQLLRSMRAGPAMRLHVLVLLSITPDLGRGSLRLTPHNQGCSRVHPVQAWLFHRMLRLLWITRFHRGSWTDNPSRVAPNRPESPNSQPLFSHARRARAQLTCTQVSSERKSSTPEAASVFDPSVLRSGETVWYEPEVTQGERSSTSGPLRVSTPVGREICQDESSVCAFRTFWCGK